MEKPVGRVTHFFPKIGVAVVALSEDLKLGEEIHFAGPHTDFTQKVTSMQVEHSAITSARTGQEVGMKVDQNVKVGDRVLKAG